MKELLKKIKLIKEPKKEEDLKKEFIIKRLKQISEDIEKINLWFQMENDDNLIDACIYQREVLNAQYNYLINKIRTKKIF